MIWVGLWDLGLGFRVYVFALIGFIRTLYINIFQRLPKANQVIVVLLFFCVWVEALWKARGSSCSFV